ncbi:SH2 domain-containing protein 3C [Oryzias melastigma]|uniref:SH2 domain-containing protein 3C n=1 Tax=Oryzias melastigma TaxID=30732 RepID=A0A834CVI1_ORYME|nr:SH2 domain-containing protein 3C [Oryzias melastigma]
MGCGSGGQCNKLFLGFFKKCLPFCPFPPTATPCFEETLQAEESFLRTDPCRTWGSSILPLMETVSHFKPSRYQSQLMFKDNKPLEVGVLRRVKELLATIDPHIAAKHITKADCQVGRILGVTPGLQRMMGVSCGMELLTLPHGQQLRLDLLERLQTMAIMLAVHVLGCTGTHEERAVLLQKIIQIAAELKNTTGNMFGFSAVMRALELPQMSHLEQTWAVLRQRHTEGAILYEKTLLPFFKSLNEGRAPILGDPQAATYNSNLQRFLTQLQVAPMVDVPHRCHGGEQLPWRNIVQTMAAGTAVEDMQHIDLSDQADIHHLHQQQQHKQHLSDQADTRPPAAPLSTEGGSLIPVCGIWFCACEEK